MKKKKILYVITKSVWGGAQRYVYDLATRLPTEQFEIGVVCGGQGLLVDRLEKAGVRVISPPALSRDIRIARDITAFWQLVRVFASERPDIIHLNSSKVGGLGAVAARIASLATGHRALVTFTAHGWALREERPWWQRLAIIAASWCAALFQDRIIVLSNADYRIAELFAARRKLIRVAHGIEKPRFLPRGEGRDFFAHKLNQHLYRNEPLIGVIAELTRNKGLNYLIDAVNQVKSKIKSLKFKVIIMGDGEDRAKLQQEIDAHGLGERVYLAGFIPDAAHYLHGFDLVVLPSVKEGLPYALLEAMHAGVPIIASRVGGIPDLIEDKKSGLLVPPRHPGALAQAIALLMADFKRGALLARAAEKRASTEHRIEAMIQKTIAVYLYR